MVQQLQYGLCGPVERIFESNGGKGLPFGIGIPIGWINGFLWNNFGNESSNPKVTQVGNRSYAGWWWALPGMINNFADFTKFAIKEHMPPRDADSVTYEVAPFIIISTTLLVSPSYPMDQLCMRLTPIFH